MDWPPDVDPVEQDDQVPWQMNDHYRPLPDLLDAANDAMTEFDSGENDPVRVVNIGKVPLNKARENFKQALRELRPKPKPPTRRPRSWLLLVAIVLGLIAVIDLIPTPATTVPESLVGTWQTTTPDYRDQGFALTADAIGFRTGAVSVARWFPVVGVASDRLDDGRTSYRITYDHDGETSEFPLTHDPRDSTIRLANQPAVVWLRQVSP